MSGKSDFQLIKQPRTELELIGLNLTVTLEDLLINNEDSIAKSSELSLLSFIKDLESVAHNHFSGKAKDRYYDACDKVDDLTEKLDKLNSDPESIKTHRRQIKSLQNQLKRLNKRASELNVNMHKCAKYSF